MLIYAIWGLRISISVYAVLHFVTYFLKNEILLGLLAVSGFFIFLFAGVKVSLQQFKLPLFLVGLGIILLLFSHTSLIEGLYHGLILMRDIIGLLVIIPMISWVLNNEPYIETIMRFAYKILNTSRKFYTSLMVFTQIISYFLLFGCIPMMYQFVNKMIGNTYGEVLENFKSTAILRAFALSTIWVVSIPSFIFAVETLRASLWMSIFQGFGIAMAGVIISIIFSRFDEKKYGIDLSGIIRKEMAGVLDRFSGMEHTNSRVYEFMVLFITLFGTIFLLHAIWPIDLMMIIPLVIIIWTFLYYTVKKRYGHLLKEIKTYFKNDIVNQAYQLSVMLGAGMMIYSINQTGFGEYVVSSVNYLQGTFPAVNVLYFLPFIVIFLGFVGLGPLTVMVLVAGILENIALPYPPELIVLTITSGSVISIMLSPLIMPVIVLSGVNGLGGFKNGIRFNWKYSIVFYIMVQIYVQTMIHVLQ